ncbi:MAG: nicotinamide riboside transporter PnuC [Candidatus Coproplasma sp.]
MKEKLFRIIKYFTSLEWSLWLGGMAVIITGFCIGADKNLLSLFSALLGVSCVIFNAKGSVWGQIIAVGFAFTYAAFAYINRYYGETIIYLALMLPIHIASIISWMKNRNDKSAHREVTINRLSRREYALFAVDAAAVSVGFYFLLYALNTDNLIVSTISLVASMGAAYLMLRRCEYFSLCFIANDIVLLVLWSMKIPELGTSVVPSLISFVLYLLNDSYSFFNWKRIKRRQQNVLSIEEP